jgi:hypothetical protein
MDNEKVKHLFDHIGIKVIKEVFPGDETEMLDRLKADTLGMGASFLFQTCRLIMSYASDAQEHLAHVGDGDYFHDREALNELKKSIVEIIRMKSEHDFSFDSWKQFRETYTSNY